MGGDGASGTSVAGHVDEGFERVRDTLAGTLAAGTELGACITVNVDGREVVDIWGGWRDRERTTVWDEDTIVNVFSATKTVASLAVLMLADRGELDLFAPVSTYWPEFAQNGKEGVEVRHLLGHSSGVAAWDTPFTFDEVFDVPASTARLATQAPFWKPGTEGGYHASSYGHLVSELVLRVTGSSLSDFIVREFQDPLDADFHLGLTGEALNRVAPIYPAPVAPPRPAELSGPSTETMRHRIRSGSMGGVVVDEFAAYNSPRWRRSEFAGSSGHGNSRGLSRIISAVANGGVSRGVRLLSPETIDLVFQVQADGIDHYYEKPIRWGIGFALATEDNSRGPLPFLRPSDRTCFWYGGGGSLAIMDVGRGVTVSYAMNQGQSGRASLNGVYYAAVYEALDELGIGLP